MDNLHNTTSSIRETLDRAFDLKKNHGITRLADITNFSKINLPVWIGTRPNAKCLSQSGGKGLTSEAAMLSALMEGIEVSYAENIKTDDAVKPLTAILTLNTIAHTMGAAGVGAEVQSIWDESWLTVASVILTIAVLIFSEIIPKTLGSVYWKQLATPSGWILYFLTKVLSPLFIPILWAKKRLPQPPKTIVTRDELAVLADIGEEEGTLEEDEETVIHNLLKLRDVPVMDIMTPRVVTTAFEESWTIQQVMNDTPILRFSRIPVFGTDIDDLKGFVIRSEILTAASRDEWSLKLSELVKPLEKMKQSDSVDQALELFLARKVQIAAVIDDFGGTSGILTMEDVIETLLGEEIVDELDEVEDMRELAMDISGIRSEE